MGYITKADFARKHNFSKQYVSELLREGTLKEEANSMLDESEADYALSLKKAMGRQKHESKNKLQELLIRIKLQNEFEKGKLLKLETAEKERSLIPADKVHETLFKYGRVIRDTFLNLPDRVSTVLEMQDARTIHITLTKEIRAILEDLSNG